MTFAAYTRSLLHRRKLVNELLDKGVLHSDELKVALMSIPREAFVAPFFYRHENTAPGERWKKVDATDPSNLPQIYQDDLLVTLIDDRGDPISSSSMPTVMVQMIETLQVDKSHQVLEVGTGTGYNATILASLSAGCTTVDVEPSCVEHLHSIIDKFHIDGLSTFTVNGMQGYPSYGPYDRILITASAPTIPHAWIDQLAPGGRLVCDFAGSMEHAFLILSKDKHGHITGDIRPERLWFMPLYGEYIPDLIRGQFPMRPAVLEINDDRVNPIVEALPENRSFRWFLQTYIPGIKFQRMYSQQRKTFRLIAPNNQMYLSFVQEDDNSNWHASLHADVKTNHDFLDSVFSAYDLWKNIQPPVEDYHVSLSKTGEPMFQIKELTFPMLALAS